MRRCPSAENERHRPSLDHGRSATTAAIAAITDATRQTRLVTPKSSDLPLNATRGTYDDFDMIYDDSSLSGGSTERTTGNSQHEIGGRPQPTEDRGARVSQTRGCAAGGVCCVPSAGTYRLRP